MMEVPVSYTHLDVYKRQTVMPLHTNWQNIWTKFLDNTHKQTHTHTHTHFSKNDFFHVLRVVQSESAIISNTIFFAITIQYFHHFLMEHGSKISLMKYKCFVLIWTVFSRGSQLRNWRLFIYIHAQCIVLLFGQWKIFNHIIRS